MGFIKEMWALTRFEHAIMLAIAVLISETIILGGLPALSVLILLSLLVPILSEAGSFALNDYLDIESDRINKKFDRPLVKGTVAPEFALWFSIVAMALSIMLSFFINFPAFIIALVFNLLAVLYNWKLKDLPLIGNLYIALTMAIPFIFGNFVVSDSLSQLAIVLALLGFVSGLAREITKSVQDMEGDKVARKSQTIPMVIGAKPAIYSASILYLLFIPISLIPFSIGLHLNFVSGILIAIAECAILFCVYSMLKDVNDPKSLKSARTISLVALFIGLIGLLAASL